MSLNIPFGVKNLNPHSDVNAWVSDPFASVAAANAAIPTSIRQLGLSCYVLDGANNVKEYWYNGGTANANLVEKVSGFATVAQLNTKQNTLVSGTNIKTINGTSLLGSGNIEITGGATGDYVINGVNSSNVEINATTGSGVGSFSLTTGSQKYHALSATVGNITTSRIWDTKLSAGHPDLNYIYVVDSFNSGKRLSGMIHVVTDGEFRYNGKEVATVDQVSAKQDTLTSGANIKTINGISLLGSGDIEINGGGSGNYVINSSVTGGITIQDNSGTGLLLTGESNGANPGNISIMSGNEGKLTLAGGELGLFLQSDAIADIHSNSFNANVTSGITVTAATTNIISRQTNFIKLSNNSSEFSQSSDGTEVRSSEKVSLIAFNGGLGEIAADITVDKTGEVAVNSASAFVKTADQAEVIAGGNLYLRTSEELYLNSGMSKIKVGEVLETTPVTFYAKDANGYMTEISIAALKTLLGIDALLTQE